LLPTGHGFSLNVLNLLHSRYDPLRNCIAGSAAWVQALIDDVPQTSGRVAEGGLDSDDVILWVCVVVGPVPFCFDGKLILQFASKEVQLVSKITPHLVSD
jgi:hypothetical protein